MKSKKTKEEIAAEKEARRIEVAHNRQLKSYATRIKNNCKDFGLRSVEMQLEFAKAQKSITAPKGLSREELISCFERGIQQFKDELQ